MTNAVTSAGKLCYFLSGIFATKGYSGAAKFLKKVDNAVSDVSFLSQLNRPKNLFT
jgi:hypothetical protein